MPNKIFSYQVTIEKKHLDSFGHVNNAVYLNLFEDARWELINKNGYTLQKIQETKLGPTILEINIKFLHELRLHDVITIQTQLISYDKKIGKITQKMFRDEQECCTADFVIGLFDLTKRKLISPTPEWLFAVGYEKI